MLTPEYLNLIEFNDVVELYNKLNIEITADIISRISIMNDITSASKKQMKILLQTNGTEVFNEALEKTSLLTRETKNALKLLFENMAKEDIQGYEELYEYREKPFKLSETQYNILNQGLKQTNKTLKNMTNTIAFQSQQAYVNAVDEAYMKVVSGAFDYTSAINTAVQQLADKGITLKDKLGRNIQLETAVRRNVLSGIHTTANNINRNIETELGCDGYEVTAHLGARPSHAEEQGKQFAVSKKDASKYGLELWSDVAELWEEYNCRHSYFGIILGISEPVYTNNELEKLKNATVTLNGKQVPYYKATQRQRQFESDIRNTKRSIQTLDKAGIDSSSQRSKLRQLQMKQTAFCKETGLQKDYARMKIAKIKTNEQAKYKDITEQFNTVKKYKVKQQQYYKDTQGIKYFVDGKNVLLEPSDREKEVAKILGKAYGGQINIIPRINNPANIKTPDYIINNERFDLKEITGTGKYVIEGNLRKKKNQANNFIIDVTNTKMDFKEIERQIRSIYISKRFMWVDKIFVIKENKIINAYKRK
jgi:hypothetical protein|nr:MAG TPA: minor capsid protein [Bacteriophage sp.]